MGFPHGCAPGAVDSAPGAAPAGRRSRRFPLVAPAGPPPALPAPGRADPTPAGARHPRLGAVEPGGRAERGGGLRAGRGLAALLRLRPQPGRHHNPHLSLSELHYGWYRLQCAAANRAWGLVRRGTARTSRWASRDSDAASVFFLSIF
jgi:hypothetical protein